MTKLIRLRGHHIEALAERYFEQKRVHSKEKSPVEYKDTFFVMDKKPAKLERTLHSGRTEKNYLSGSDPFGIAEKMKVLFPLMDEYLANPGLELDVVYGPDSLCNSCPAVPDNQCSPWDYTEKCEKQDALAIDEYGLDVNKTYTIRELIEIFEGFFEKTGSPSPRVRDGFGKSLYNY